jgi:4-coumarate--CoA ligase
VLGIYSPNCIDTPAVIWGTSWAGGVTSPANPGYTTEELAFQLKDSGAKALVTQKAFLKTALEACKKAGIEEDRIILIGDERDATAKYKHFTNIRNISGASRYRKTKINPSKDLAFLVYSSGTTVRILAALFLLVGKRIILICCRATPKELCSHTLTSFPTQ